MSVSTPGLLQHCLAASAMSQLIQEWHVKDCTDPDFAACLYCSMRKLYYVLPPGYICRWISSWYKPFPRKVQGIRNDDQSRSPVTPLDSLFSLLIP